MKWPFAWPPRKQPDESDFDRSSRRFDTVAPVALALIAAGTVVKVVFYVGVAFGWWHG